MTNKLFLGSVLVTMLVAAAPAVLTAYHQERFEISPMLGGLFGGEFEDYVPGYGEQEIHQANSALLGIRTAYFFSSNLAFEGAFGYSRSKFSIGEGSGFFDENPETTLTHFNLYTMSGSLVVNFIDGPATPYFDLGGGVHVYDMDESNMDSKARWEVHIGGGARFYFSDVVGMRIDIRGYYTFMRDTDDDDDDDYYDWDDDSDNDAVLPSLEVSTGLIFLVR